MEILKQFEETRRAGVPLVAVTTSDPSALMKAITDKLPDATALTWDAARGVGALNDAGEQLANAVKNSGPIMDQDLELAWALEHLETLLPEDSLVFVLNAQDQLCDTKARQAIWNRRDYFKMRGCTLVLLAPSLQLPSTLIYDVITLDDPLPADVQLQAVIEDQYKNAGENYENLPALDEITIRHSIEACRGLSTFGAEQVVAMSIRSKGINIGTLWNHKRAMIQQTPGLTIYDMGFTFDDIGGLHSYKEFMTKLFRKDARRPLNTIVFIDEIEKAMAGIHGDNTGVSQDFLQQVLTNMQDFGWTGMIAVGPPGSGKSLCAQATGNTFDRLTIRLDLGAMKGSLVGESERQIRNAMKVIKGIAGAGAFFVATCNSIEILPPELQRRFKIDKWFFDLPNEEERASIWDISRRRYQITGGEVLPNDTDWTGSEIDKCCDNAERLGCSLVEAARWIRPIAYSQKDLIERMRIQAHNNWNSASYVGAYQNPTATPPAMLPSRRIRAGDD
jgi:hypothetical protein